MKNFATRVMAFALCATLAGVVAANAANSVRISQVYGGGGNTGATYNQDYVELFNNSGVAVDISGWSVQYGSPTGLFGSSAGNFFVFPAGTFIQPCKYILVGMASGANGVPLPVTPDFTTGVNMGGTNGKVAIINNSTGGNACSGNTTGGIYVDVVGYGTANCFETAVAPAQSSSLASVRGGDGQLDTDNNSTDITSVTPTTVRNSASPANIACLATPTMSKTWGAIKTIYR